jgi:hypothetical protein
MAHHPWKPGADYRSAAARTPIPEAITVVGGIASIAEAPADPADPTTPMVVTIGGAPRSRVLGTPGPGEYRVRVIGTPFGPEWVGELEMNAADEGATGTCDYYRTGTVVTALRWQALIAHLRNLTGIADLATLYAQFPPSTDQNEPGWSGRIALLTDGTAWISNGVEWVTLGGTPAWTGDVAEGATAGAAQDAAWVEAAASVSEAATAAAAQDAVQAEVGAATAAATAAASQDGTWAAGGGGTPLLPADPSFETADPGTVANSGAWWSESQGGGGQTTSATRLAAAATQGSVGVRLSAANSAASWGQRVLSFDWTKAQIDATTGVLTFDVIRRGSGISGANYKINARAFNAAGWAGDILWQDTISGQNLSAAALTLDAASTRTFNLKDALVAAGVVWANVNHVALDIVCQVDHIAETAILDVDNFR